MILGGGYMIFIMGLVIVSFFFVFVGGWFFVIGKFIVIGGIFVKCVFDDFYRK